MIDERKLKILQAIISDYINTGEPVGSRTIAKRYDLGISSATIRNEMADLEDMGFLEQPHTSAGRVPSSKGYRLYVDRIMEYERLSMEEELRIRKCILDATLYEVDKVVKQASSLLSELTNLTCVANKASVRKSSIKSIQLIQVDTSILCVMVTDSGVIKNNILKVSKIPTSEDLSKINNIINKKLKNLTIEEMNLQVINDLKNDLTNFEDIFNALIPTLYEALNSEEDQQEVYMEGTTNIFNYPEYNDIDRAKEILNLLYNKDYVSKLIKTDNDITIRIGDENFIPEAKECSVISAVYFLGDKPIGTIGLIGPRRINYSKVVAIMTEVMKELNETLNKNI
ncbi:heat-inducible transcription repressor HrcA [Clostridium cavendishii DSM 21758]|uniref:Heat-inducible transcription repressor HrcA n=1 Tax=Clostridium cavendishii DSM 21758 TaxID=1121302 RepID=A0A1M6ANQ3_9CLOT|nr:heat-inducible transcription repressor HrcA [Clostridium cavendishii DSM 21758]